MTVFIKNFALGGYRSFGREPQRFESLKKITLLIGRNNSGKSNVIRFLTDVYPPLANRAIYPTDFLDRHLPDGPTFQFGKIIWTPPEKGTPLLPHDHSLLSGITTPSMMESCSYTLGQVLKNKADLDKSKSAWTYLSQHPSSDETQKWMDSFKSIEDTRIKTTWNGITGRSGGSRVQHWVPELIDKFAPKLEPFNVKLIPAIRQIGEPGSKLSGHDGKGIIEQLSLLQHPTVEHLHERKKFLSIRDFLREVTECFDLEIEIPHDLKTILVCMNGKALPIESLGTGIHEVLILAAAATVNTNCLICIEEPELHLNPLLQRKLINYLNQHTENQYIISTHSTAIMDTTDAEVYHIRLENGCSIVDRVTSDTKRSQVCEDLGFHPSDLMQANCIIWVEGPSDRIYVNHWINKFAADLQEGIHYSVMFYGGKLASHLSCDLDEDVAKGLISLRRLNRRSSIIIDSDKSKVSDAINPTKTRLVEEFNKGPGHAWVTDGREIENYLAPSDILNAISNLMPNVQATNKMQQFQSCLKVKNSDGKVITANKVGIAHYIADNCEVDLDVLDLRARVENLVKFIRDSNPNSTTP